MHGDGYSRTGARGLHRGMDHESRSMYSKGRDRSTDRGDMDSSRHGMLGGMNPGMYGGMPAGMPAGMYPGMYGGMPGFGVPHMMQYPPDMPRRYMDRHDRSMEMPYGRYMDMPHGRYMSSQDRLMHMMHNRHLYGRMMDQSRMGEPMEGNMETRGRNMDNYE